MGIVNTIKSSSRSAKPVMQTTAPTVAVCNVGEACNPNVNLKSSFLPEGAAISQFLTGGCTTFNTSDDLSPIFLRPQHLMHYIEYVERNPLPYTSRSLVNASGSPGTLSGSTPFAAPDAEAEYGAAGILYIFDFPALTSTQATYTYEVESTEYFIPDRQNPAQQQAEFTQTGRFGAIFAFPSFSVRNLRFLAPIALRANDYDRAGSENNVTWTFGPTDVAGPFGTSVFPTGASAIGRVVGALDPAWEYIKNALLSGSLDSLSNIPAGDIAGGTNWDGGNGLRKAVR